MHRILEPHKLFVRIVLNGTDDVWVIKAILDDDRIVCVGLGNFLRCFRDRLRRWTVILYQSVKFWQLDIANLGSLSMAALNIPKENPSSSHAIAVLDLYPLFLRLRAVANGLKNLYMAAFSNRVLGIALVRWNLLDDRSDGVFCSRRVDRDERHCAALLRIKSRPNLVTVTFRNADRDFWRLTSQLVGHILDDFLDYTLFVASDVKTGRVQERAWIMMCAGLTEHAPHDLRDLVRRPHFFVYVGEAAFRIIPTLLQAQLENNVLKISSDESVVVVVAAGEEIERWRRRKFGIELQIAVDGDFRGIDLPMLD